MISTTRYTLKQMGDESPYYKPMYNPRNPCYPRESAIQITYHKTESISPITASVSATATKIAPKKHYGLMHESGLSSPT